MMERTCRKINRFRNIYPKVIWFIRYHSTLVAPAKPVVAVGDAVLKGQMIAEAGGFVSAPIYATVSGTVKAIEPRRVAVGDMVNSIVVENDGEFKSLEFTPVDDVASLSKEEIIKKIQNAGIVGMGGAGFPTHVKLSPKEPEKIDYIIGKLCRM